MKPISKEERLYWLVLSSIPRVGSVTFFKLLSIFGSAKKAWFATQNELENNKISKNISVLIPRKRKTINPQKYYLSLIKDGIEIVCLPDKEYPQLLKNIKHPPPVLYYKGSLKQIDNQSIAVVGTRRPSLYGRQITKKLVSDLALHNITIVSGLARGIDGIAHKTALNNHGRTIAYLGSGLNKIYPQEHKGLASKIVKSGCIISEYPPRLSPKRGNFPARNRLISGMSQGVLIIESLSKSGTMHTANHAKNQNKPIFVLPSLNKSPLSKAPLDLIDQGAILVKNADDIMKNLNIKPITNKTNPIPEINRVIFNSKEEEIIYNLIKSKSLDNDQIIRISGLGTTTTLTTLSFMEINGLIIKKSGKYQVI